jgi:hypothetical protein
VLTGGSIGILLLHFYGVKSLRIST